MSIDSNNKRRVAIFVLLFIALIWMGYSQNQIGNTQKQDAQNIIFPLEKGNFWIYEGTVKWMQPDENIEQQKKVSWKMEVIKVINRQQVTGVLIKGHPFDLVWYNDTTTRGDYLIVLLNNHYYLICGNRVKILLSRLKDDHDNLQDLVKESELFLVIPLYKGFSFGETEFTSRQDNFYCWYVEDYLKSEDKEHYSITYRSLPNYINFTFTTGMGITKYKYHHNGTISDVEVLLKESNINKN